MPRRDGLGNILVFLVALVAASILFGERCRAEWADTSRTEPNGARIAATESCQDDGACLEVYVFEGEIWGRLRLADDQGEGIDPTGQPKASVDNKRPLVSELYLVDGRELRFQIWDGRGDMSKQMRRWIMGRKVNVRYRSTGGETRNAEFSLRGSSAAIKRVVGTIYKATSGELD